MHSILTANTIGRHMLFTSHTLICNTIIHYIMLCSSTCHTCGGGGCGGVVWGWNGGRGDELYTDKHSQIPDNGHMLGVRGQIDAS